MWENLTLTTKEQQRTEVVSRWLAGILTTAEVVLLLGCSERTAWRLRATMLRDGAAGLVHGNRGRPSARRLPDDVAERIIALATSEYRGSTTAISPRSWPRRRASPSAAPRCGGCSGRGGSPRPGGDGRHGIAAAGSGWPRRAC
jgi:hypothetical protein